VTLLLKRFAVVRHYLSNMMDLLYYGMYLDAREGTPVEDIARSYRLPLDVVEERIAAARLCFEQQVQRIEFKTNTVC
jgi:hypothetical protein